MPKERSDGPRPAAGVTKPAVAAEAGIDVVGATPEVRPRPEAVKEDAGALTAMPGASSAMRRRACWAVGDSLAENMTEKVESGKTRKRSGDSEAKAWSQNRYGSSDMVR